RRRGLGRQAEEAADQKERGKNHCQDNPTNATSSVCHAAEGPPPRHRRTPPSSVVPRRIGTLSSAPTLPESEDRKRPVGLSRTFKWLARKSSSRSIARPIRRWRSSAA